MKKIIGDPKRFAAIVELSSNSGGVWLYGKCCFRIVGVDLGDYELGASLRDVLMSLEVGARDWNRRQSCRFSEMSSREAFDELQSVLGKFVDESENQIAWEEEWVRFKFLPEDSVFDEWEAYVVENEGLERVIFSKRPFLEVHEAILRAGECDEVLREMYEVLGKLYDSEAAANNTSNS